MLRGRRSIALIALSLTACSTPSKTAEPAKVAVAQSPEPTAVATPQMPPKPVVDPNTARIKVIGISDFHGWLLPLEPRGFDKSYGGIAYLGALLRHKEHVHPDNTIVLDNGDMWTGPTESTFLRGEPVIRAYNEIGLTAANVANHEFDYGLEILRARIGEAKFPFLGANIMRAGSRGQPTYLSPYIIVERDGVKVAIVGISYIKTPQTTLAVHVQGLEFQPYGETLQRVIPEVKGKGAEVIIVLLHDTVDEIATVLEKNPRLGIHAIVAGQNHRKGVKTVDDTPIINPGPFGRSYVRFDIEVDRKTREVTKVTHEIVDVVGTVGSPQYPPEPKLAAIAEGARQKALALSGEQLGKLGQPLPVGTFENSPLGHLVVDSWLAAFPDVDFAVCNHGALRQPVGKGPVTIGDLTSVLPFENNLYIVKLTGRQLRLQLAIDGPIVGGMTWTYRETKGGREVVSAVDRQGKKLED